MSNVARLIGNSTWNGAAFLVGVGLNLISLPFAIRHIGISEFGLAGLIIACVAPAMVFSNTLYQVTTRELAQAFAKDGAEVSATVFATAFALALLGGGLAFGLLVAVAPHLAERSFHLASHNNSDLMAAFAIAGAGWMFQCLSVTFQATFAAGQDFRSLAQVNMMTTIATTLCLFVALPMKPAASTFLACQSFGFVSGFLFALMLAIKRFPHQVRTPWIHRGPFLQIVRFGSWQASAQAGGMVAGQADRYLLGAYLGPQYVGFYNVAQRLEEAVYIGVLKLGEVLFPLFSSISEDNTVEHSNMMFRASWLLALVATASLGAIIPVAEPLLTLWTNASVADETYRTLIILSLAGMLGCGTNVFMFFLLGRGQSKHNALISLTTAASVALASFVLLPFFGWAAAGLSTLIGMVAQLILVMVLIRKSFSIPDMSSKTFHFIVSPIFVGAITAMVIYAGWTRQVTPTAWWSMGLMYALSAIAIAGSIIIAAAIGPYRGTCIGDLNRIVVHLSSVLRR
jgi:O-antigen/teichoic acid export membrane protein